MTAGAVDVEQRASGREGVILAATLLTGVGLVAIFSASAGLGGSGLPPYFVKHAGGVLAGVGLAFVASRVPLALWRRVAWPAWGVAVLLLVLVPLVGVRVNGARRWLGAGGAVFQPVELAKVATLIAVAHVLARRDGAPDVSLRGLLLPACLALVPTALLLLQPDLGNAVVLLALVGTLLLVAGAPLRLFVIPIALGVAFVVAYVQMRPYAAARIAGFLDPWATSDGKGYQLVQSFVAFARGGLFGIGFGAGRQKLAYLPEAHTDFILATVAEEIGLVGVLIVLGAFTALLLAGVRVAKRARDRFAMLMATGMTLFLTLPAAINAAVVTGTIPTKGLAMPFLSYGRSSTLACFIALGILAGIGRREAAAVRPVVAGAERRQLLR